MDAPFPAGRHSSTPTPGALVVGGQEGVYQVEPEDGPRNGVNTVLVGFSTGPFTETELTVATRLQPVV